MTNQNLTPRELEILNLIAKGYAHKHVAARLEIGDQTVSNHMIKVLSKLKASNAPHAVAIALRKGMIK